MATAVTLHPAPVVQLSLTTEEATYLRTLLGMVGGINPSRETNTAIFEALRGVVGNGDLKLIEGLNLWTG